MARVAYSTTSRRDIMEIRNYIATDSPVAARAMVRRIRQEVKLLDQQPRLGRTVPEYGNVEVREIIVGSYRVIYRFDEQRDLVVVLAVFHGSRLLPPRAPDS